MESGWHLQFFGIFLIFFSEEDARVLGVTVKHCTYLITVSLFRFCLKLSVQIKIEWINV